MSPPILDQGTFRERFGPDLNDLARRIHGQELVGARGWQAQLAASRPGSALVQDWRDDREHRLRLKQSIEDYLAGEETFQDTCKRITRHWGGIKQLIAPCLETPIRETLEALQAQPDRLPVRGCGERITSVSRVYACLDPERWVVLDTRVSVGFARSLGLTNRQHRWTDDLGVLVNRQAGPSGGAPGFRRIWPSSRDSAFRAFMLTSWACQFLAEVLDHLEPGPGNDPAESWSACHVERVFARLAELPLDRVPESRTAVLPSHPG